MRSSRHLRTALCAVLVLPLSAVLVSGTAVAEPNGASSGSDQQSASSQADRGSSDDHRNRPDKEPPRSSDEGTNDQGQRGGSPPHGASDQEPYTEPQEPSNADSNGSGANPGSTCDHAYCSTRDGSASGNGNADRTGDSDGRPCAGCVGKADNKNPPGQAPDASDANRGYECDENSGIARTNPAHTGCPEAPPVCVDGSCTPPTPPPPPPPPPVCVGGSCTPVIPPPATVVKGIVLERPVPPAFPEVAPADRVRAVPVAAPSALPFTGTETSLVLLLGGYVVVCGAYAVWVARVRLFAR